MAVRIKPLSLSDAKGLCTIEAKCVKKNGHAGDCWPKAVKEK